MNSKQLKDYPPARDLSAINEIRNEPSPSLLTLPTMYARSGQSTWPFQPAEEVVRPVLLEIMNTKPQLAVPASRIDHLARKFRVTGEAIVVVTDGNGHVRGVITRSDLVSRVCANRLATESTQAVEIMTTTLVECAPTDDLETVMWLMMKHRVRHVLVTSGLRHRLHGVVGIGGVAKRASPEALRELVIALSYPVPTDGANHQR